MKIKFYPGKKIKSDFLKQSLNINSHIWKSERRVLIVLTVQRGLRSSTWAGGETEKGHSYPEEYVEKKRSTN